ncbi:hypothetical protein [Paenibacillus chitinolyticus]|uniref:hypothetical protein n=1 Tax=Paenibacillus chitinolyticus TaxID=79263 RepID=UPI00364E0DAB
MRRSLKEKQMTQPENQLAHSAYSERIRAGAEQSGMEASGEIAPAQGRFKRTAKIPPR